MGIELVITFAGETSCSQSLESESQAYCSRYGAFWPSITNSHSCVSRTELIQVKQNPHV